jgi:hypothetical protein
MALLMMVRNAMTERMAIRMTVALMSAGIHAM